MAQLLKFFLVLIALNLTNGMTRVRRLIGGTDEDIKNSPYMAALVLKNRDNHLTCGAAILSSTKILTAASCLSYYCPSENCREQLAVITGSKILKDGNIYDVKSVKFSKNYDKLLNDIAIVTVEKEIKFSETEKPVNLPSEDIVIDTTARASGWGITTNEKPSGLSETLKNLEFNIISNDVCSKKYQNKIDDNTFCAVPVEGSDKAGLCFGDGGVPLIQDGKVIGVYSYGNGCANNYPDVFTNVYRYLDFIKNELM